jgi:hypothetical protein
MAAKKAAAKKAAPAKKKAPIDYPKGASKRSQNAASTRMEKEARTIGRNEFSKRMYDYIKSEGLKNKFTTYAGIGEGGSFASTGLDRKRDAARAKELAARTKAASQQMKQGVTKSGGYSRDMWTDYSLSQLRGAKSDKFKAEQAVKKSGGSLTRNAGNKKKNAK